MPKQPSSICVAKIVSSPNADARPHGTPVDILLMHYTGMRDAPSAIERLCDPQAKVSSHYVVDEAGGVIQLVDENARAWHAGVASWHGHTDINARSIGIEIVNRGHDFDYPDFPERQIAAVIALSRDILARHPIPARNVLAHSDVAPARKIDPGEKFPWEALWRAGVGHYVPHGTLENAEPLAPEKTQQVIERLCAYGYDRTLATQDAAGLACVVRAFQRHFRPARVDGIIDASTLETLIALTDQADLSTLNNRPF